MRAGDTVTTNFASVSELLADSSDMPLKGLVLTSY